MKTYYLIILCFILILSCSNEEEREWENLKASKDFEAIENLILQNPDSKHLSDGIELIFNLKKQKDDTTLLPTYPNYYGRNTLRIIINKNSELEIISEIYRGKTEIETLRQILKNYFINENRNHNLPELKTVFTENPENPDKKIYELLDSLLENRILIFDIKEHEERLAKTFEEDKTKHNNDL